MNQDQTFAIVLILRWQHRSGAMYRLLYKSVFEALALLFAHAVDKLFKVRSQGSRIRPPSSMVGGMVYALAAMVAPVAGGGPTRRAQRQRAWRRHTIFLRSLALAPAQRERGNANAGPARVLVHLERVVPVV